MLIARSLSLLFAEAESTVLELIYVALPRYSSTTIAFIIHVSQHMQGFSHSRAAFPKDSGVVFPRVNTFITSIARIVPNFKDLARRSKSSQFSEMTCYGGPPTSAAPLEEHELWLGQTMPLEIG